MNETPHARTASFGGVLVDLREWWTVNVIGQVDQSEVIEGRR